jgi:hypothetical protein
MAERLPISKGCENYAAYHAQPVIFSCGNEAHLHQRPHERDGARDGHGAGGVDWIIEQFLQHWRSQGQSRQQDEAAGQEHDGGEEETVLLEQFLAQEIPFVVKTCTMKRENPSAHKRATLAYVSDGLVDAVAPDRGRQG